MIEKNLGSLILKQYQSAFEIGWGFLIFVKIFVKGTLGWH